MKPIRILSPTLDLLGTEIYEASGFKLDVTFGNSLPTLIQKLKQELRNVSNEVLR